MSPGPCRVLRTLAGCNHKLYTVPVTTRAYVETWNCKHLANANKFGHIRRINTLLGLYTPSLVTPLELLGADNDT